MVVVVVVFGGVVGDGVYFVLVYDVELVWCDVVVGE